mgnify:CR=1 FL=1
MPAESLRNWQQNFPSWKEAEKKVLLATDPFYKKILRSEKLYNNESKAYKKLMKTDAIERKVRFYVNAKLQNMQLVFSYGQQWCSL